MQFPVINASTEVIGIEELADLIASAPDDVKRLQADGASVWQLRLSTDMPALAIQVPGNDSATIIHLTA